MDVRSSSDFGRGPARPLLSCLALFTVLLVWGAFTPSAAFAAPACSSVTPALGATITCTYNAGGNTAIAVPAGTGSITAIVGGGGGAGGNSGIFPFGEGDAGGPGARVSVEIDAANLASITVVVGKGGSLPPFAPMGGGGGGGGFSSVYAGNSTAPADVMVVAGGGGGGGGFFVSGGGVGGSGGNGGNAGGGSGANGTGAATGGSGGSAGNGGAGVSAGQAWALGGAGGSGVDADGGDGGAGYGGGGEGGGGGSGGGGGAGGSYVLPARLIGVATYSSAGGAGGAGVGRGGLGFVGTAGSITLTFNAAPVPPTPAAPIVPLFYATLDTAGGTCVVDGVRVESGVRVPFLGYSYIPGPDECSRTGFVFIGWARVSTPTLTVELPLLRVWDHVVWRYFIADTYDLVARWKTAP